MLVPYIDKNWLGKIEENIAKSGIKIYEQRKKQINIFEKNLQDLNKSFNFPFNLKIKIKDLFFNENLCFESYILSLFNNREIDKLLGGAKIGPHKSDIKFYIDHSYPASQLSTGQQKTLILLLYFSQCNYLINICKKKPILFLDEINSHLDEINTELLLKILNEFEVQAFMTGTKKDLFSFLSTNTLFYNISEK